jgi:hypothetical protein
MYKTLFSLLCVLLFVTTRAQIRNDLYAGLFANGGLSHNPDTYFPAVNLYGEAGASVCWMRDNKFGYASGLTIANYGYSVGRHGEFGYQNLSYLKVPLGLRLLFSRNVAANVKFEWNSGLAVYTLMNAQYVSYSMRTSDTRSKESFTRICVGAYLGCGMQIRLSHTCFMTLGAQSDVGLSSQSKDEIQGHVLNSSLGNFVFNIGVQQSVFSWMSKERKSVPSSGKWIDDAYFNNDN